MMQHDHPDREPLDHAAAREAHHSLGGYFAQVWRSVLAWTELKDDEILFLEAAEDFDILRPDEKNGDISAPRPTAEAVQVKNMRAPVSLRSADVVDAIGHAYDHQRRNPGYKVVYRYMTTAGISVERGAPFGRQLGGIKAWQRIQQSTDAAARARFATDLAAFLGMDDRLPDDVRHFVETASTDALLAELVDKIIWDTEIDPVPQVVTRIKDRLVLFGREVRVDHRRSEAVAATLFEKACRTAAQEDDRRLTRAEFCRTFEQDTKIAITVDLLERLLDQSRNEDPDARSPAPDERSEVAPATAAPPSGATIRTGNRLAIIVGDVLDVDQAVTKAAFEQAMQTWRARMRGEGRAMSGPEFAARQNEHAFRLLNEAIGKISEPYLSLARLRPGTVVSLHPDPVLERTFSGYRPCAADEDLVTFDLGLGTNELFLLGGSAVHGVGLTTSGPAALSLANRLSVLGRGFRDKLAMCDILAIGVNATHFATQRLLQSILEHRTDRDGRVIFVDSQIPASVMELLQASAIAPPIGRALDRFASAQNTAAPPTVPDTGTAPVRPFKYLDYYTADDAQLFRGRDADTERIVREIKAAVGRIIILTGRSGAGKTSIINASIAPLLEREYDSLVIYARCGEVPEASIIAACEARTGRSSAVGTGAPNRFGEALGEIFADERRNCLIVLDQAEEAFVTLGSEAMRRFVANMETALGDRELPLRFMFVVREDYMKELLAINGAGFPILDAPVYLDDLSWDQARQAMIEPFLQFGIHIEEALADVILGDLDPVRIVPAHLSIVCDWLYSEMDGSPRITLEQFRRKKLGTQSILGEHLKKSLKAVKPGDAKLVEAILLAMVTGDGTKALLSAEQIAGRAGIGRKALLPKLRFLIHDCRLLREVDGPTTRFELAHETLAMELHARIDRAKRDRLVVQDMLGQQVATARFEPHRLISPERLSVFDAVRDNLAIDDDALALIVASYAQEDAIPAYWLNAAATLDAGRLAEAILVRPSAAGYAYPGGILFSAKRGELPLRPFRLSELSAPARRCLVEQIAVEEASTLEMLAGYVSELDDGAGRVALVARCIGLIVDSPAGEAPSWLKALFDRAVLGIETFDFADEDLDDVRIIVRQAIVTLAERHAGIDPAPLDAWLWRLVPEDTPVGDRFLDQVIDGVLRSDDDALDVAILRRVRPFVRLEQLIREDPLGCFRRLIPLLFDAAPDRGLSLALALLPELDVGDIDFLTGEILAIAGGTGVRNLLSRAEGMKPEPQLIHLLYTLYSSAPARPDDLKTPLLRAIRCALLNLSHEVLGIFPSYDHIDTRFVHGANDADKFYRHLLEPQWQVLAAYAAMVGTNDMDWPSPPDPVWRAASRLYVASGSQGSFATLGSIEELVKRHADPDDWVSMALKLATEGRLSVYRSTLEVRRLIFRLLAESVAPPSRRSERDLDLIVQKAGSPADRVGALLVLQKCGSALLTPQSTERLLRGDSQGLSPAQRTLLGALTDTHCRVWSDEAVLALFKASDATMTQLAGRCLDPSRSVFRGRPHIIKAAIAAIRTRPIEYRQQWLKTAQSGLGAVIPPEVVEIVRQSAKPVNREIAILSGLYK